VQLVLVGGGPVGSALAGPAVAARTPHAKTNLRDNDVDAIRGIAIERSFDFKTLSGRSAAWRVCVADHGRADERARRSPSARFTCSRERR
jgi:hypothetical protein